MKKLLVLIVIFGFYSPIYAQDFLLSENGLGLTIREVKAKYEVEPDIEILDDGCVVLQFPRRKTTELYGSYIEHSIYWFDQNGRCDMEAHSVPFKMLISTVALLQRDCERTGILTWRDDLRSYWIFDYDEKDEKFFYGVGYNN